MSKSLIESNIGEYQRLSALLQNIERFAQKHQVISYIEFDYYVVHDMTLFSVEPDFDFEKLALMIQQIKKAIPAIKRIFDKPIIVLRDADDILPVENTRIINQNTLLHIANHGQYVTNITKTGIKPRKLLTRVYEDDYSIYENVVFCNFIDEIQTWIKRNRRTLNSLLYAGDIMKFNLYEKVNHLNFFLALGKLHTGYNRDFSQYLKLSKELSGQLSLISHAINPKLKKPVYQKNIKRNKNISIRKTNIFLMQKDYRQIYKTFRHLLDNQVKLEESKINIDYEQIKRNYKMFVQLLTIFSIGHFNFETSPQTKMDMQSLDITFKYKDWELNLSSNENKDIRLRFFKDKSYKVVLTFGSSDHEQDQLPLETYDADEIIFVSQFEEDYMERKDVYISIEDIDSFRRIQQIILKGMIYSDNKRDICPFCGGKLHKDVTGEFDHCDDCMTQIKKGTCMDTKKTFFYTDNSHLKKHKISKSSYGRDAYWYYEKQIEASMHFRNITKIDTNCDIICPHCNKHH